MDKNEKCLSLTEFRIGSEGGGGDRRGRNEQKDMTVIEGAAGEFRDAALRQAFQPTESKPINHTLSCPSFNLKH